jgi:hypothetical protein
LDRYDKQLYLHDGSFRYYYFRAFSDTVIIACKKPIQQTVKQFIDNIGKQLSSNLLFAIKNEIFFRGTLAYGQYYISISARLVLGEAINNAVTCHEKSDWIGISLFPGTPYTLSQKNNFVSYPIPYKDGLKITQPGLALNWTNEAQSEECYRILRTKYMMVGASYRKYYLNSMKFFEHQMI